MAIERVTYLTLEDLNTELNLYRSGALDVTSEVPNSQVGGLRREPARRTARRAVPEHLRATRSTSRACPTGMRAWRSPWRSIANRSLAQVTGAGEQPALGWVPPGIPGLHTRAVRLGSDCQLRRIRYTGARALADRTQPRRGARRDLTLCTDASANHHRTAVALVDQWRSGARCRRRDRRDGVEGLPRHARAALATAT